MSKTNIFDLSTLGTVSSSDTEVKSNSKSKSASGSQGDLTGFTLVPSLEWVHIPHNARIKYMRKDGKFINGGYVMEVYQHKSNKNSIKFKLRALYGDKSWFVVSDSISKIWQKDGEAVLPENDYIKITGAGPVGSVNTNSTPISNIHLEDLRTDVDALKESVEHLNVAIQKMQNEQRRIVTHIKMQIMPALLPPNDAALIKTLLQSKRR